MASPFVTGPLVPAGILNPIRASLGILPDSTFPQNALVLDLSEMRDVVVSADRGSAFVSGGARAWDVLRVTAPLGLAAVTGSCGGVGIAGLTLGGGYGPLIG